MFWGVQISYSEEVFGCLGQMNKKIREERIGEGHISHEFLEHPLSEQVSHRHHLKSEGCVFSI